MRMEGILKNARLTYQQAADDKDAPPPAEGEAPRGPGARELWAVHSPLWLAECKDLREEAALLTDAGSPTPFVKEMAKRLSGASQETAALSAQVEAAVRGLGRALAAGKPPGDETAKAIDGFYAGYAAFLISALAGGSP